MKRRNLYKALFLTALTLSTEVWASVVILGTRVIYPSDKRAVSVELTGSDERSALVQAWIDDGDIMADPSTAKAPFMITPPVAVIEKNTGQTLRITATDVANLPKDRESIFYFNLLDIPPKPQGDDVGNYLQLALRSRLKLFYRPTTLKMQPLEAYRNATWHAVPTGLKVDNQSPYYISYSAVKVGEQSVKEIKMVAPYSSETMLIDGVKAGDTVEWSVVNDYGGTSGSQSIVLP